MGGLFDADGCVYAGDNTLVVSVTQAQKGAAAVHILQETFGGSVIDRCARISAHQNTRTWSVCGEGAISFCSIMHQYTFLKRDQLRLASCYPIKTRSIPVSSLDVSTLETHLFENYDAAISFFAARGKLLHKAAISACLHGKVKQHGGIIWKAVEKKEDWKNTKQMIASQLKAFKDKPHRVILERLPDPYAAGFFDGDGCFSLTPKGVHAHRIAQKYIAICDAFQKRFGGSVKLTKEGYFTWNLYKGGLAFVQAIHPFLRGKAEQGSLLLTITPFITPAVIDNVRKQLWDLKGNHWRKKVL